MQQPRRNGEPKVGEKRNYHHGNLRAALLEAAAAILEREGPQALSLRAVARRAGVSQAAPYHHFADKEALLAAVAADAFRGLAEAMRAEGGTTQSPARRLQALGRAYVLFAIENPNRFRLLFGAEIKDSSAHADLLAAGSESYGMLARTIQDVLEQGGQPVAAGQAEAAATAAWSLVHGLATLIVDGKVALGATPEEIGNAIDRITGMLILDGAARR